MKRILVVIGLLLNIEACSNADQSATTASSESADATSAGLSFKREELTDLPMDCVIVTDHGTEAALCEDNNNAQTPDDECDDSAHHSGNVSIDIDISIEVVVKHSAMLASLKSELAKGELCFNIKDGTATQIACDQINGEVMLQLRDKLMAIGGNDGQDDDDDHGGGGTPTPNQCKCPKTKHA